MTGTSTGGEGAYSRSNLSAGGVKSSQTPGETSNTELTRLIKKAMRGNDEAFRHLYIRYIKELIYHARTLLVVPEDAEDAAQEAIIALRRNMRGLNSPYAFKSYLLKTIYSVCATRNRQAKQPFEQLEDYEEVLEDTGQLGPQGSLEQKELSVAIRSALVQLPPRQREALTLRYFDDLEYEEIAQLMGVTVNTVGSNILRAKKALKHLIEQGAETAPQGEGIPMNRQIDRTEADIAAQRDAEYFDDASDPQMLKGAVFGPAVAAAISQTIDESVSSESVNTVVKGVNSALAAGGVVALGARITLLVKILVAVFVTALLVGGAVVASQLIRANETSAPTAPAAYHPTAQIVFTGGNVASDTSSGVVEQVNPTEATLVLDEGTAQEWSIVNSSGEQVLQGSGERIAGVFAELPSGEYTVTWMAANVEGSQAQISREFLISTEIQGSAD